MPPTLTDLGLDRLSVEERLMIAAAIWESVACETESLPIPDSHLAEIDRRLADSVARPDAVIPWEAAKAEILARLRS